MASILIELASLLVSLIGGGRAVYYEGKLEQQKADSDATAAAAQNRLTIDQGVAAMSDGAVSDELRNDWTS